MKLGQLVDNPRLFKALRELATQSIPAISAYKVATLLDIRDRESRKWQEVRTLLLQTYGKKSESGELQTTEDGSQYLLEDVETFNKEYTNLNAMEVADLPRISLDELKDAKLSADSVQALMPLISPLQLAK